MRGIGTAHYPVSDRKCPLLSSPLTLGGLARTTTPGCGRGARRAGVLAHPGQLSLCGVKVTLGALGAGAQLAARLLEHLGAGFQGGPQFFALAVGIGPDPLELGGVRPRHLGQAVGGVGEPGEDLVPFPLGVGAQLVQVAGGLGADLRDLVACLGGGALGPGLGRGDGGGALGAQLLELAGGVLPGPHGLGAGVLGACLGSGGALRGFLSFLPSLLGARDRAVAGVLCRLDEVACLCAGLLDLVACACLSLAGLLAGLLGGRVRRVGPFAGSLLSLPCPLGVGTRAASRSVSAAAAAARACSASATAASRSAAARATSSAVACWIVSISARAAATVAAAAASLRLIADCTPAGVSSAASPSASRATNTSSRSISSSVAATSPPMPPEARRAARARFAWSWQSRSMQYERLRPAPGVCGTGRLHQWHGSVAPVPPGLQAGQFHRSGSWVEPSIISRFPETEI